MWQYRVEDELRYVGRGESRLMVRSGLREYGSSFAVFGVQAYCTTAAKISGGVFPESARMLSMWLLATEMQTDLNGMR